MKDACETYSECHKDRMKAHQTTLTMVHTEERDRKAEYKGLKRMQCLIVAFRDGKVSNKEIKACKAKVHSNKHLNIDYPYLPVFDHCSVPDLYPSTPAYKLEEFANLPAFAKGKQDANACVGIIEINTDHNKGKDPRRDPKDCACERVTLNGPYSAGALVRCTHCRAIQSTRDINSCPEGTKLFSPRSEMDWKTIYASVDLFPIPGAPNNETIPILIVDVTAEHPEYILPAAPMNSHQEMRHVFRTSDHSPWWLRSTPLMEDGPRGYTSVPLSGPDGYEKDCYLGVFMDTPDSPEHNLTFAARGCPSPQDSYYCQAKAQNLVPKHGSPPACKCNPVVLAGPYSAGALIKCDNCLDVHKSTQKNSCPHGTKIFSPANRLDWKTFLASAEPLRSPNWIVDVTRPQDGCGGCKSHSMKSTTPAQMTWRTSDGSPWWLRSTTYAEPSGDYDANCYMDLWHTPVNEQGIMFNDEKCKYHSNAYYCQPVVRGPDDNMDPEGMGGSDDVPEGYPGVPGDTLTGVGGGVGGLPAYQPPKLIEGVFGSSGGGTGGGYQPAVGGGGSSSSSSSGGGSTGGR